MSDLGGTGPTGGADGGPAGPPGPRPPMAPPPADAPRFAPPVAPGWAAPPAEGSWSQPPPEAGWAQPPPETSWGPPTSGADPGGPHLVRMAPPQSTGALAGAIVGAGVLMVLLGLYSSAHQWAKADDLYSSIGSGFGGGNPLGSDPFGSVIDSQRWAGLTQGLLVVGMGLLVVIGGLILRRLERRP